MTKIRTTNVPDLSSTVDTTRTLPYNGSLATENKLVFSFTCFDRTHDLFNLGGSDGDGTVGGPWFLDLLDCLKSVGKLTVPELQQNRTHEFHPINWDKTNTSAPAHYEQFDYWQFRINKSKGRIIGIKVENIFYIVYLDRHHNLFNSEGYGGINHYSAPKSIYEQNQQQISELQSLLDELTAPYVPS